MARCSLGLLPFVALAAPLVAQSPTLVSPAYYTALDGNAGTTWPFSADNSGSYESGIRLQQVHGDARGIAMTVGSLALRADISGGALTGNPMALDVELGIGDSDLANIVGTFDGNYIHGRTVAMSRRILNLPQRTGVFADYVGPFDVVLPFDQPFVFQGQDDLAWDFVNYTPTATRRSGSFNDMAVPTNGFVGSVGAGTAIRGNRSCAPRSFDATASLGNQNGGLVLLSLAVGGTAGELAAIGVGATDPAIPYPFGFCNQTIYTDALIILGGSVSASGNFSLTTQMPWVSNWAGMTLSTQGFIYTPGLPQAWLSHGLMLQLPPGLPPTLPARIVYGSGPAPATGIVQNPGVQLVVRFGS